MVPRLNLLRAAAVRPSPQTTAIPCFLVPFLQPSNQQTRSASVLSSLSDVPEAYNRKIRRGRGASSGKGKTSGRGHKGQKQHGKVPRNFIGGQTPLEIVHGVRGFENQFSVEMSPINLDRIQDWVDQGRLDISKPITIKELQESRCLHGIKDGVKLLARNAEALRSPINIVVSRASATAIAAVEAAGGSVQTRYYTKESIRRVLLGQTHPTQSLLSTPSSPSINSTMSLVREAKAFPKRLPDATSRKDVEYYRDPAHRGYLSHQVLPGQGPSLFFKTPAEIAAGGKKKVNKTGAGASKGEGKIW